ncbi:hypothetical protein BDF21DRAFT_399052 [Thamnidium elegans]|nr:hypothetical protein BDF21DRAFT_399052 [Thamnidium elegans]
MNHDGTSYIFKQSFFFRFELFILSVRLFVLSWKAYERGIVKKKARISYLKNLTTKKSPSHVNPENNSGDKEKHNDVVTKEVSRSRLKALKSLVKYLLFSSQERIIKQLVKTELTGASEEEVAITRIERFRQQEIVKADKMIKKNLLVTASSDMPSTVDSRVFEEDVDNINILLLNKARTRRGLNARCI